MLPREISHFVRLRRGDLRTDRGLLKERMRRLLWYEAHKVGGLFIRVPGSGYDLRMRRPLRKRIRFQLRKQGFKFEGGELRNPALQDKTSLRSLHAQARADKYLSMKVFLDDNEERLLEHFADGEEVDVEAFEPALVIVRPNSPENDLFRYASLLWSVPVSEGFGRRARFIVLDEYNHKLIGLFALGDPVFNLRARDDWIGWGPREREKRLYNVMDIFVLGAVPPYNILLGGKLVAMIAASNEVRAEILSRYKGNRTEISKERKNAELALLTTSSALGRSSIYDRIRYGDRQLYQRIGFSGGWGHFHLNNGLFDRMLAYVSIVSPRTAYRNKFGQGPNWKMRTARSCLESLGMSGDLLRHGVSREVYGIPVASNFREFLTGREGQLRPIDIPFNDVAEFFKERWMRGRAERRPDFLLHKRPLVSDMIRSAVRAKGDEHNDST